MNLCECGCGREVKPGRRFINGHNSKNGNNPMLGVKMSVESRLKMSLAKKGKYIGKNSPSYGKKHKPESIQKMSESKKKMYTDRKGYWYRKNHTEETKRKISITKLMNPHRMFGENNPMWKGGTSHEPYCIVWKFKEYKESIKERDNYECQNPFCHGTSSRLCIHHINYNKKDCRRNNLITICNSCNPRANTNRLFWKCLYSFIILMKRKNIRCKFYHSQPV